MLESKYGEDATPRRVNIEPRDGDYSDFRHSRVTRAAENYSEVFRRAHESYFEKSGDRGNSPYDKYTYVFYSKRVPRDNSTKPVSDAEKYIKATVTSTGDGFH